MLLLFRQGGNYGVDREDIIMIMELR